MQNVKPCKVVLVGCGHIARTIYAPILSNLADRVQVLAVCDLNQHAADQLVATQLHGARVYTEAAAMLDRENPDAIMVLTSEVASASMAKQMLAKNVPIYLEKPPALSLGELQDLMAAEAEHTACIFTAFNRRHTPLFQPLLALPGKFKKMSGLLSRRNRAVGSFPFTSVHLVDSAQYFGQSPLAHMDVAFEQNGYSSWSLHGELESGATCALTFVPDAREQQERLTLETDEETCELTFPDPSTNQPEIRLTRRRAGTGGKEVATDQGNDFLERTGYAPCLRCFIDGIETGTLSTSVHRLSSCVRTIEVLEAMQRVKVAA